MNNIPHGYCECGCGEKTKVSTKTDNKNGWVKGKPFRYINGHNRRKSPNEYLEEDRGYSTLCWIWQRHVGQNGYGYTGRHDAAHRVFYERHNGPIPKGLEIDHLCSVRACVNPEHLEPVTRTTNARRGKATHITMAQARQIRILRAEGLTHQAIADLLDISIHPVVDVLRGRTFRDI